MNFHQIILKLKMSFNNIHLLHLIVASIFEVTATEMELRKKGQILY